MRGLPILTIAVVLLGCGSEAARYPLVLRGGRVMDPATGLDSVRDVAIQDGRIVAISSESLDGDSVIDVAGKVVAPGFIDLHAHGQTTGDMQIQARDGVTTALEMEIGVYPVAAWYSSMEGQAPVNYGATVSHVSSRFHVFNGIDVGHWPTNGAKIAALGPRLDGANKAASPAQVDSIAVLLNKGLSEGALGVGFGINYTPAATKEEIATMFRVAKGAGVPAFVHTRAFGIAAIREAIAAAKETGASLHIVHIGSSALNDMNEVLPLIDSSRAAGMDLTTEVYPYSAASTLIESAMFNPGWEQNLKIGYGEIEWTATGERLTRETFDRYRKEGGYVVMYMMKDANIERAIAHPNVMIGTDGIPFVNGKAHPRGAGSFSRVLGYYSREKGLLPLMDALAKMTIHPARRLETYVPAMKNKGRIAIGADADITVFDPATIVDQATFSDPMKPPIGIHHVLVNGVFVVRNGELITDARPGKPVRRQPGQAAR
jgi:N-acyl-D-aspartate/D-glutamate deacylase